MQVLNSRIVRALGAMVVAIMCVMAFATTAFATVASGETFTVDNYEYKVTVSSTHYVQFNRVVNPEAEGTILTVPATVDYDGETYSIVGINTTAFKGCTQVEDIRIPDLDTGRMTPGHVAAAAFDECSSLKVIHFMGQFAFDEPTHYYDNFGVLASVKFVIHGDTDWCFDETGGVTFPAHSETYYAVNFVQGTTQTVYVQGPTRADGVTSGGYTPAQLADPTQINVYCDADLGDDSVCPIASVPALTGDNDAWYVNARKITTTSNAGTVTSVTRTIVTLGANDTLSAYAMAEAVDSTDLAYATIDFTEDTIFRNHVQQPAFTVTAANGAVLDAGKDFVATYTSSDGTDLGTAGVKEIGDYTLTVTGILNYTGTTSVDFSVEVATADWVRAYGKDRLTTLQAISAQASVLRDDRDEDDISTWARIAANEDDWASLIIADSLAGLFDCTVTPVSNQYDDSGALPSATRTALTTVRNGNVLVVGSTDMVSEDYRKSMATYINGTASRVTAKTESTPAQEAVAAYTFVRRVEAGEISLALPDGYASYGTTAMVLPSTESASAFSAMAWAAANRAPVFFLSSDGTLDADTIAALTGKDADGNAYFDTVYMVGTTKAQASAAETTLADLDVEWITSGSTEMESSQMYAGASRLYGPNTYSVTCVATASDYAVLSCSAAVAGLNDGVLLVLDFANDADEAQEAIYSQAPNIDYGRVMGGFDQIPQSEYEEMQQYWDQIASNADINLRLCSMSISFTSRTADGTVVTPTVVIKDTKGNVLTEGVDYTLSYYDDTTSAVTAKSNLAKAGHYTVVATGTYKSISGGFDNETTYSGTFRYTRSAAFTVEAPQGWQKTSDGKWTYYADGSLVTGWKKIGSVYYYFDASGIMQTGWLKSGSTYYYLASSGKMVTGWQKIGGKYYYFASSGKMCTGWLKSGSTYYYLKPLGAMATGWQAISGSYYYFASSGKMYASKWLKSSGKWYWFKASGKMAKSETLTISGKKYTFLKSGALK